jgi:spore coat protein H
MDKYYSHNRLSFGMMKEAGFFDLFYSFCELRINGCSEGIFMAIERPEDWAIRKKRSPLILRRGYDHRIDKIKTDKKTDRSEMKKYLGYYREIYRSLDRYEGEELYNNLSVWLDMENYLKLLAFNFFVRNGDYSDEVFFYIDPEINKFRVIPWDYDDIFALAPHEGKAESKKNIGDKLIFSAEDLLDRKVATDTFLYQSYLKCLNEVLEKLSPEVLKMVFEETFAELYPYYSDKEIISNVQYDHFSDATMENLKNELTTLFIGLAASRDRWLNYLKSSNK